MTEQELKKSIEEAIFKLQDLAYIQNGKTTLVNMRHSINNKLDMHEQLGSLREWQSDVDFDIINDIYKIRVRYAVLATYAYNYFEMHITKHAVDTIIKNKINSFSIGA